MEEKRGDEIETWAIANSTDNAIEFQEEDEEEDEALSLSDLPLIHQWRKQSKQEEEQIRPPRDIQIQDDFDFCSLSKEHEMCSADELFFKGQILPLRHSVSSEKGLLLSRSESMDRFYSGLISSRSSSINSHHSTSSSSGSATSAATLRRPKFNPKLPPRNQFHSHPSPSPKLHFPTNKQRISGRNQRNCPTKSSPWSIFRLGLVTAPPEIAFQDLKTRCPSKNNSTNGRNFGSRNSTSSNSSNNSSAKKKARVLPWMGGCKCSADAVDTVSSRVVIITRSASEGDVGALQLEPERVMTKKRAAKKHLSHHRTFEWLKQLSLEGAPDES